MSEAKCLRLTCRDERRFQELRNALHQIGIKASGGMTSFTAEAKHQFLNDIAKIAKRALDPEARRG